MTAPIPLDIHVDQIQAMKEDLIATLTPAHIEELCTLRTDAKLAAESFSEAIKAQAEKCGLSRSALRRYVEEASRWWRDYVVADTPPPPSSELEARQRWPWHTPGKVVDLDEAQAELIRDYAALKRQAKSQEALEKILRDQLFPVLADADEIRINGQAVATYRANKASDKTDWKALADELLRGFDPEDRARYLADYTTTVPGPRVLRLGKALEA